MSATTAKPPQMPAQATKPAQAAATPPAGAKLAGAQERIRNRPKGMRPPGRPPGSKNGHHAPGPETAERTAQAEPAAAREAPKARKADTKEGQRRAAEKFVLWHKALAKFTGLPTIEIDLTEATLMVESWADVTEEFGIEIGGRAAVVLAFVGTASGIYLPRVLITLAMIEQARRAQGGMPPGGPQAPPQGSQAGPAPAAAPGSPVPPGSTYDGRPTVDQEGNVVHPKEFRG